MKLKSEDKNMAEYGISWFVGKDRVIASSLATIFVGILKNKKNYVLSIYGNFGPNKEKYA